MTTITATTLPAVLTMGVERSVARALAQLTGIATVPRMSRLGVDLFKCLHWHYRRHNLTQRHWIVRFRATQKLLLSWKKQYVYLLLTGVLK